MEKPTSAARRLRLLFRRNPTAKILNSKKTSSDSSPNVFEPKSTPPEKLKDVVQLFKNKSSSAGFRWKHWQFKTTVDSLARDGRFSHVDEILQHQKQYPDINNEHFTSRLIAYYGRAKMLDHAVKLFDEMPELNCPRTVVSFNTLLGACFPSENYDKVLEFLRELPPKISVQPNVVSYTLAVKALCKKGSFDDAVSLLDEMAAKGVDPDAITFDAILSDLYHCGKFSEAENVWNSMKEKKVEPDLRCYNSRLYGMLKEKRLSNAMELVKEMEEKGMKLNTYAYNLFIKAFVDEGDVEEVKKWYAAMEESGGASAPNIFTYVLLVPFASEKISIDYASELCKKSINANQGISRKIVMDVRDELLKHSKVEEAKELLELFNKPKTVEPTPNPLRKLVETFKKKSDLITFRSQPKPYYVIVRRLAQAQQLSLIDEVLQHQKQYPSIRDERFTARLIALYGEANMLDRALQLFDEMPELSCPRTASSFNALLAACFNYRSFYTLLELFCKVRPKLSIEPDVISYTWAVKAHCRKGSYDDAVSLVEEMVAKGFDPDSATFHTLLNQLYHDNRFSEGEKAWELMKEVKVDPDLRCYNSRLYGMLSEKRFSDAVELVREMEEKGVKLNAYAYNLFIKVFVEQGEVEVVKKWYTAFEESEAAPNTYTYVLLIPFACEKIGLDYAFELCKKSVATKRKLSRKIVMNVRDELLKNSMVEEAEELAKLFMDEDDNLEDNNKAD